MKKTLFSLSVLLFSQLSFGQSVDANFGSNGTVTHAEKGSFFQSTLLSDGKVILSGNYETSTSSKAVMLKLNTDGSLDTSFGTGGVFTMDLQPSTDYYEGFSKVEVQSDGKLFLAYGSSFDNGIDPETLTLNLIRLNANGTSDTTFTNAWSTVTTEDEAPYGFKVLPSGKYLAYGENYLMRFNANGSLDTTYGNNGTRTLTIVINELFENAGSIYIDGNTAGNSSNRTFYKLTNESATISTSTNYGTGSVYQNNGEFFIDKNDFNTHELSKFDANLSPVLGFGTNGKVSLSSQLYVSEMMFQTGGSIILYSNNYNSSQAQTSHQYTRLNSNGALNTSFGQGGTFTMNIPDSNGFQPYAENMMHPNGSIYSLFYGNYGTNNIFVKRILLPNEMLSVIDAKANQKVEITENPVQNTLKLSGDLQNINVYDLSGKVILRNCSGKEFNATTLSSGIYNLTGVNNKGEITKLKFIKK